MTLSRDEFLRRFLLHLLPKGFVRIRHFLEAAPYWPPPEFRVGKNLSSNEQCPIREVNVRYRSLRGLAS